MNTPSWLARSGDAWVLVLHVQPGARRTEVQGRHGDALKLRLAAPPVDGKANAELIRFVAQRLAVPRTAVTLVAGQTSRSKRLSVDAGALPEASAVVSALWDDDRLGPLG
ncbi:DUF167 domain-containing protein [Verticiella sediminum]|uniref:UPF0235 protein FOZ76_20485 n=1 Tax=Verticiella sediminum TaxID=1247510 RepID=A0A556ABD9_9BURK|nr:DUF167 domain-containing protein [Verticiella sediminum]TSH90216.1 DUF167 domain-containing protein [Verticiella sediminum]